MNAIQFTTFVGPDGVIGPPAGVELPQGEFDVEMRPRAFHWVRRKIICVKPAPGKDLTGNEMAEDERERFIDDVVHEDRQCGQ